VKALLLAAAVLLAAAPVATSVAGTTGRNLLLNPSFETMSGEDNTVPDGWTRFGEGAISGRYIWDIQAGRVFGRNASGSAVRVDDSPGLGGWMVSAPVRVDPRREYILSGFVSVVSACGEVRLAARLAGDAGPMGEVLTPAVSVSTGNTAQDWVPVAVRFRPPEGANRVVVACRTEGLLGSAWFEDLSLVEAPDSRSWGADDAKRRALAALRAAGAAAAAPDAAAFGAAFGAAFARRRAAVEAETVKLREGGKFWQAADLALRRASAVLALGLRDLDSGWPRRGWERLETAARDLGAAAGLARKGAGRPDPLPAAAGGSVPAGVSLYVRYPATPQEVASLVRDAASFGFGEAMMDFPWAVWEPERGKYDFTLVDAALDAAAASGIRLHAYAGPRYALSPGRIAGSRTSPRGYADWYLSAHPESALSMPGGKAIQKVDGMFWELAFVGPERLKAVPGYLSDWGKSLEALAGRVASRPGLAGWVLSYAPRMGQGPDALRNLASPGLLGYNAEIAEAFRSWLKDRYGTVAGLRKAWGRPAPASFAAVAPPGEGEIDASRFDPARRYPGSPARIADWLLFRARALGEGMAWERRVLEGATPGRPVAASFSEFSHSGPLDPDGLAPDLSARAAGGPLALSLSADFVPFPLACHGQDAVLGAARAAGDRVPIWLTEYSLRPNWILSADERQELFPPAVAGAYVSAALLSGARGFFFKGWSSRPAPYSFAEAGCDPKKPNCVAPEGEAVVAMAQSLRTLGGWLAGARTAGPRYAVLVSWPSRLFDDPGARATSALLNALALAGIHEVAMVTDESLAGGERPAAEVLFAPWVARLGPRALAAVKEFVTGGGALVTDTYLASGGWGGVARGPMPDGIDEMMGLTARRTGTGFSDAGTIGAYVDTDQAPKGLKVPVSLSFYGGGWRVAPRPGTEVHGTYTGSVKGEELPAVTVHRQGKGTVLVIPRCMQWGTYMDALSAAGASRPELRVLKLGRNNPELNGVFVAMVLKSELGRLGLLPPARLVRAPVSESFLAGEARVQDSAGVTRAEAAWGADILRRTQAGLPGLSFPNLAVLRAGGVDLDAWAPVRIGMLEGASGGKLVIVANFSSLGRDAEVTVPGASAAVDVLTGEEFPVLSGRVTVPLGPCQSRWLALFGTP